MNNSERNFDQLTINYIYSYYVKYDRLELLINEAYANSGAKSINVFIDVMDIFRNLDKRLRHPINHPLVITSGIINMVAHYRQFFRSRYSCESKFWLISSIDNVISKEFYKEFNPIPLSTQMQSIYNANMEYLPSLCQYIPDVQYLETKVDFITKAVHVMLVEGEMGNISPSLAITKDPFEFSGERAGMRILRPRKTLKGDDESYIVYPTHTITRYVLEVQGDSKLIDLANTVDYNKKGCIDVELLMALSRVPTRSLSCYMQMKSALSNMQLLTATRYQYAQSIDERLDILHGKIINFDKDQVKARHQACNVVDQIIQYSAIPEAKLYQGIVNLYDPDGVKDINNKYFSNFPLDLNVL